MLNSALNLAIFATGFSLLMRKSGGKAPVARRRPPNDDGGICWLIRFSLRPYQPMVRLAGRDDQWSLLSSLTPEQSRQYRRRRRSLLREYLRGLAGDFNRLHAIAAARTAPANREDAGIFPLLAEQKTNFIFQLWSIEARILINALMPHPHTLTLDLQPLLSAVDTLAGDTRALVVPGAGRRRRYRQI